MFFNQSPIDQDEVARIWRAQGLGEIHSIQRFKRGIVNQSVIVNEVYVLRLDTLNHHGGVSRYVGEKLAYDTLRSAGVPVPQVIALDTTRTISPRDYLIVTRLPGEAVIDGWKSLSAVQQRGIAAQTGECLAAMHQCALSGFGDLGDAPYSAWYQEVEYFFTGYAEDALRNGALTPEVVARMAAVMRRLRPALDSVMQPALVHADCHFENILQEDGMVTGVIDFEWGKRGDPLWDFRVEDKWEEMCPGSREPLLAAYALRRPLPPDYEERVRFYKMLMHLDDVAMGKQYDRPLVYHRALKVLLSDLRWLESHLP